MSISKWAKVSATEPTYPGIGVFVVLALVTALIPAVIVVALIKSGESIHDILTGGAGVPGTVAMGIAGTFAIIVAVMWLIFPWMVCSRLSKIHAELKRIEHDIHGK